jgi:predicted ABC-type transport system involved in lysophospholipase L1 biosynthesis ATPase subunit
MLERADDEEEETADVQDSGSGARGLDGRRLRAHGGAAGPLSDGEQQMLAFGRALTARPRLIS